MYPSIKSLMLIGGVTRDEAQRIRDIMNRHAPALCACGNENEIDRPDNGNPCDLCRYYHDGRHRYSRMRAIDRVLHTFGVECIEAGTNQRSPAICYCNAGDPYHVTILKVRGRFRVGCWGDIVERGNYQ